MDAKRPRVVSGIGHDQPDRADALLPSLAEQLPNRDEHRIKDLLSRRATRSGHALSLHHLSAGADESGVDFRSPDIHTHE